MNPTRASGRLSPYRNVPPTGPIGTEEGDIVWLVGHEPSLRFCAERVWAEWPGPWPGPDYDEAPTRSMTATRVWMRLTYCPDAFYSTQFYFRTDASRDEPEHPRAGTIFDTACDSEYCHEWHECVRWAPWALPFTRCEWGAW